MKIDVTGVGTQYLDIHFNILESIGQIAQQACAPGLKDDLVIPHNSELIRIIVPEPFPLPTFSFSQPFLVSETNGGTHEKSIPGREIILL